MPKKTPKDRHNLAKMDAGLKSVRQKREEVYELLANIVFWAFMIWVSLTALFFR
jgi:hypothetical protein